MTVAPNIKQMVDSFYRSAPKEDVATKRNTVIIGFGHRARQGKDTVVEHLIQKFATRDLIVKRYSFADALKIEVFDWLQALRFTDEHFAIDCDVTCEFGFPLPSLWPLTLERKVAWINDAKEDLRPLLQKWGTQFRRTQDPNYWVKKLADRIAADNPHAALISDMRFKNEAAICDETVRVERNGYVEPDASIGQHISETEMNDYPYDYELVAEDGQLSVLLSKAEELFDSVMREHRILIR